VPGRSFRIARIAGIPVCVSVWWLVMLVLVAWSLGASYFPAHAPGTSPVESYALGLAAALLLCVSILAHELGHAIGARRNNIAVVQIDLWLLGGVARLGHGPRAPRDELRYAAAGPAVSAVFTACAALALFAVDWHSPALHALVEYELLVNASLLAFNLLPAFPLDGGCVLRAVLWRRGDSFDRATERSAGTGCYLGYLLGLLGGVVVVLGTAAGLWLVAIAVFLVACGRAEAEHARLHGDSSLLQVATMMSRSVISIPDALSVQQAADSFFLPYHYTAFPVVDGGAKLLGIATIGAAEAVPVPDRNDTLVREVTICDPSLRIEENFVVGDLLDLPSFARVGHAIVIDHQESPVGMISIADIRQSIRALRFASPTGNRAADRARSRRARILAGARATANAHGIGDAQLLPGLLLADDDEVVRIMLSHQLEPQFSIVGAAADAKSAVALAREHHPAVAVLDIQMPGGGLFAARGIARESPQTAVVMLTSDDTSEAVLRFVQAGAVSFLRKGIAVPELAPRLQDAIATHAARRAAAGLSGVDSAPPAAADVGSSDLVGRAA